MRKRFLPLICGMVAAASGFVATAAGASTNAPGVTSSTVSIGLITSITGADSSSFGDSAGGAEARFALQNAQGGVDGRKLKLVTKDDSSTPQGNLTAAQELSSSSVFGIIESTGVDLLSDKALNAAGVPETSWEASPIYPNVFSFSPQQSYNASGTPAYEWTYWGTFMKSVGVTKLASITYPQVLADVTLVTASAKLAGIKNCYTNTTIPYGSVDFTVPVLAITSLGCNGLSSPMVDSSNIGLATGLQQAGVTMKGAIYDTGYDQSVLDSPSAVRALDGSYFGSFINMTTQTPAIKTMLSALKKYDPLYKGGLPDYGTWTAYASADLMIKGLEEAGKNPTRSSFITNLRQVGSYNANGLFPTAVSFKNFGTPAMIPKTSCLYFIELKGSKFVPTNGGNAWCGKSFPVAGA